MFLASGGALALAIHPADDYVETHVVGNPTADRIFSTGKVLASAPFQIGTAVSLYFVGRQLNKGEPRTHPLTHLGFDLMRSQIVAQSIVYGIKYSVQRDRPSSAISAIAVHGLPSLAATYVATSRLVDQRHFLSDVVFGAALGEAVGWTVVGRHRTSKFALQPVPLRGGIMIARVRTAD